MGLGVMVDLETREPEQDNSELGRGMLLKRMTLNPNSLNPKP